MTTITTVDTFYANIYVSVEKTHEKYTVPVSSNTDSNKALSELIESYKNNDEIDWNENNMVGTEYPKIPYPKPVTICVKKSIYEICQEYVTKVKDESEDNIGLCVTITPTCYEYPGGWENGFIVGLINYPRFPSSNKHLIDHSLKLAEVLMKEFEQLRVSVVTPDKTYMLSNNQ